MFLIWLLIIDLGMKMMLLCCMVRGLWFFGLIFINWLKLRK